MSVLNAAATNPMENYSADTIELVRDWFDEWNERRTPLRADAYPLRELAARFCGGVSQRTRCLAARTQACLQTFRATDELVVPHPKLYRMHVRFEAIAGLRREAPPTERRHASRASRGRRWTNWWSGAADCCGPCGDYQRLVTDLGGTL